MGGLVGTVNISDDDLIFQNLSLSFLLTTSCKSQNVFLKNYTYIHLVIFEKFPN